MPQCVTAVDDSVGQTTVDDLVITALAESEAALLDRIVDLTSERDSYRLCFQQAIHALHDREIQIRRLRESVRLLRDELRRRCVQGAR